MGDTLKFFFGIFWWTLKTIIKKTVKWADKKKNNFSIYDVAFFSKKKKKKKRKEKKTRYRANILKFVFLGHFLPFLSLP